MGMYSETELSTILIFEKISADWVREVHGFTSARKKKEHYVIFRDSNNRKLNSLKDLKSEGVQVDEASFRSAHEHSVVSNKVGAHKIAKKAAEAWSVDCSLVDQPSERPKPQDAASAEKPIKAAKISKEAKSLEEEARAAAVAIPAAAEAEAEAKKIAEGEAETETAPSEAEVAAIYDETARAAAAQKHR